jgi:hypothetical protein
MVNEKGREEACDVGSFVFAQSDSWRTYEMGYQISN